MEDGVTVGEALAEARAAAGLSVAEVSERTRIRETVIQGMEQDDFTSLGGDLYVRGYLRAIAGAVGVDPQPLIQEFDHSHTSGPGSPAGEVTGANGAVTRADVAMTSAEDTVAEVAEEAEAVPAREDNGSFWSDDAVSDADPVTGTQVFPGAGSWWPEEEPAPPGGHDWMAEPPAYLDPGPAAESPAHADSDSVAEPVTQADPGWMAEPPTHAESGLTGEPVTQADPGWTSESDWTGEPPTHADPGWTVEPPTSAEPPWPPQPPLAASEWTLEIAPAATPAWADAEAPRSRTAQARPPAAAARPKAARPRRKSGLWITMISLLAVAVLAIVGVASAQIVSRLRSGNASPASSAQGGRSGQATAAASAGSHSVLANGQPTSSPTSPTATPTPSVTPAPAVPVQQLAVQAAEAFGPKGVADGDNPQHAAFAITPKAALPWKTDWYTTADFGNLKQGTGLLLDMGRQVTVMSVSIRLGSIPGADLQVRVGDTPVLSDLTSQGSATDVSGQWTLQLKTPAQARYIVIWFTKLPPSGTGTYQASIYSATVNGHP